MYSARQHSTRTRESRENDFVHADPNQEEPVHIDSRSGNSMELTQPSLGSLANTSTFLLGRKVDPLGATTRASLELPPSPSIKHYDGFEIAPPARTESRAVPLTWYGAIICLPMASN